MRISCNRSGYLALSLERLDRMTEGCTCACAESATVQLLARAHVSSVDAPGRGIGGEPVSRPPSPARLPRDWLGRSHASLHEVRGAAGPSLRTLSTAVCWDGTIGVEALGWWSCL